MAQKIDASTLTNNRLFPLIFMTASLGFTPSYSAAEIEISQDLSDLTEAERAWLEDDSTLQAMTTNSGQLNWLTQAQTAGQYGLENDLTLPVSALTDGWILFTQCHNNLDPIHKIEVQYNAQNTRNLTLASSQNIEAVQIDNQGRSAILFGVQKRGRVCISGESKSLEKVGDGYLVKRGPYMRKFLDGYYPMSLKETINWSQTDLKLNKSNMQSKIGRSYDYSDKSKTLSAEYWFEGRLSTRYLFNTQ